MELRDRWCELVYWIQLVRDSARNGLFFVHGADFSGSMPTRILGEFRILKQDHTMYFISSLFLFQMLTMHNVCRMITNNELKTVWKELRKTMKT
jgi:hypothetical protein